MKIELLQFTAPIDLQAAEGQPAKPPRFEMLAYSGGFMSPNGFRNTVIDLAGMVLPASLPILMEHDSSLQTGVVGTGQARVDGGKLLASGTLVADLDGTQHLLKLARGGVALQASIGADPVEVRRLEGGERVRVNGREHVTPANGGLLVVRSTLREISVVAVGADSNSSTTIAAKGSDVMPLETTTQTPAEIITAERARFQRIDEICRGSWGTSADRVDQLRAQALAETITVEKLQGELLGILRAGRPAAPTPGGRVNISSADVIQAALLQRVGRGELAAKLFGGEVAEQGHRLRATSLVDLAAMALTLEGATAPSGRQEMLRAAFSTLSLPTALSNVTGKILLEEYAAAPATWRSFAKVMSAADFKPQVGIRPSFVGNLEPVASKGEIKHGTLGESTYPWSVDTYAKMMTLSRQDVINDDVRFLDELAPMMARMAARSLSDLVWSVILANAGSFFSTGNGNYREGADTALTLASLQALALLIRTQRDAKGYDLDIVPKTLVVPPELETTARTLLNSELIETTAGNPTGNAMKGLAALEVESRLSNSDRFAGASATQFYLFGSPMDAPVIVGYLDGATAPTVEFFGLDHDVNTLAMSWRCFHDFGAALADHRAAAKSKGAA